MADRTMQGTRVEYGGDGPIPDAGAYWNFHGTWFARCPNGAIANLANHTVHDLDDGTITVNPSILVRGHGGEWHGYLICGEWREC